MRRPKRTIATLTRPSRRNGETRRAACRCESGERHRERRSEEHTSELQSRVDLVCRLLLEKKKKTRKRQRRTLRSRLRDFPTRAALAGKTMRPRVLLTEPGIDDLCPASVRRGDISSSV